MRILIFIVAIGLLLYFINSWLKLLRYKPPASNPKEGKESEKMVRCAQCGSYLPVSRAVAHNEKHFCSRDHLVRYLSDEK
jgi:uncharacterized protein